MNLESVETHALRLGSARKLARLKFRCAKGSERNQPEVRSFVQSA